MIGLAFVLALAGAPTPSPGWVVVQRDGSIVQLAQEPKRKGGVLVGTLFPDGKLVSIRVEDVDEAKTAAANRARTGGLETSPAQPLVGGSTALGDRVRLAPPTGDDAAHRELDAARKALAGALAERDRFERTRPPGNAPPAWTAGLSERTAAVEKARLRVDRARKRVEALAEGER
ncbi:MAG TPA: hypothetical protein VMV60_10715 [Thermoanaerobaculia bacterium]|nr:hypothetical protein [Thermoanaerobaculia bacterium]